ncbi:hypothetical protein Tco_1254697 [Tanacetum coccineum]
MVLEIWCFSGGLWWRVVVRVVNAISISLEDCSAHRNSPKRLGKDTKGNTIVHPHVSLDEHVAVQRENKVRTLLLQALPKDHMPNFHHYDDAKRYWLAVKAQVSEDSEPVESCAGMARQWIDINMKFLRALPSSWSHVRGGTNKTRDAVAHHSILRLYGNLLCSGSMPTFILISSVLFHSVSQTSVIKISSMKTIDQVDQLEMEEKMDLNGKWLCFSLRINRSQKLRQSNQKPWQNIKTDEVVKEISPKAYQHAVKTLESQKDWYHKTQMALEEKIRVLSMLSRKHHEHNEAILKKLHDQNKKKERIGKSSFEATLARLKRFQEYFGVDEVFDLSTPSVFYSDPVEKEDKPLYSRFVKAGEMHAVPPPITGTYMPSPYSLDLDEHSDKSSDSGDP